MVEKIKEMLEKINANCWGLRVDDYKYNIGDTCHISHQLFQDPEYDEEGELLYPYCEDGIYEGFYDAGELNGTCSVGIDEFNIEKAIKAVNEYFGEYTYLIYGDYAEAGNDNRELIIHNAKVAYIF